MHPLPDGLRHPRGNGKRTGRFRHGQHLPKGKIFAVMDAVRALEVKAPVHIGDILCENIADTGSNLVAAADLDAE